MVVYVHGLWQRGAESFLLRRRLARDLQADARTFSYASIAADASSNARQLAKFLAAMRADTLHLVGHSLGGLVILRLFEEDAAARAWLPPGRIVLLGAPLHGSRTAQNLARLPLGRAILGRSGREELLVLKKRRWSGVRELGVIAGSLERGVGRLLGKLNGPNDGTVLVSETQLDGAADQTVLRVSHTGMVFSEAVANAAGVFLKTGRFAA
ncbi:MAG: alpha/beta hydrolase [Gammaproteobacteria bacterium]